jgi:hypothetical protein
LGENVIYDDRNRLTRALRVTTEDAERELELDGAARDCAEALLTGDLDGAQSHAERYFDLKGERTEVA